MKVYILHNNSLLLIQFNISSNWLSKARKLAVFLEQYCRSSQDFVNNSTEVLAQRQKKLLFNFIITQLHPITPNLMVKNEFSYVDKVST